MATEVICGGCGRQFRPDATRKKFCDHDCYAASLRIPLVDRFWSKVNRGALNECWLWTAKARLSQTPTFDGYGSILGLVNGKRRPLYSHRVAWELTFGTVPDGLFVLHKCDVSICCNPNHLFLGTQQVNLDDARAKGRLQGRVSDQAALDAAAVDAVLERVPSAQMPIVGDLHISESVGSAVSQQLNSFAVTR